MHEGAARYLSRKTTFLSLSFYTPLILTRTHLYASFFPLSMPFITQGILVSLHCSGLTTSNQSFLPQNLVPWFSSSSKIYSVALLRNQHRPQAVAQYLWYLNLEMGGTSSNMRSHTPARMDYVASWSGKAYRSSCSPGTINQKLLILRMYKSLIYRLLLTWRTKEVPNTGGRIVCLLYRLEHNKETK